MKLTQRQQDKIEEKRTLEKEESLYLIEGIDIDDDNKTVSFNPNHEDGADTSILLNPTYSKIWGINVISIFKRKPHPDFASDGNPLIYALKRLKGWKFLNPTQDIVSLLRQFVRISEKIEPIYDTIITVPSGNRLNTEFLHRLNKVVKAKHRISDLFFKLSSEDVYEDYLDRKQISKDFGEFGKIEVKKELVKSFRAMGDKNKGIFSYKFIKPEFRKYVTKTMHSEDENVIEFGPFINGKRILILDDTISSGSTISEITKSILATYKPKSVTVITLFSKL